MTRAIECPGAVSSLFRHVTWPECRRQSARHQRRLATADFDQEAEALQSVIPDTDVKARPLQLNRAADRGVIPLDHVDISRPQSIQCASRAVVVLPLIRGRADEAKRPARTVEFGGNA